MSVTSCSYVTVLTIFQVVCHALLYTYVSFFLRRANPISPTYDTQSDLLYPLHELDTSTLNIFPTSLFEFISQTDKIIT